MPDFWVSAYEQDMYGRVPYCIQDVWQEIFRKRVRDTATHYVTSRGGYHNEDTYYLQDYTSFQIVFMKHSQAYVRVNRQNPPHYFTQTSTLLEVMDNHAASYDAESLSAPTPPGPLPSQQSPAPTHGPPV